MLWFSVTLTSISNCLPSYRGFRPRVRLPNTEMKQLSCLDGAPWSRVALKLLRTSRARSCLRPVDAGRKSPLALMKIRMALRPDHRIALQTGADTCTGFRALSVVRRAVRDVIRRCIYAVDKNPLAVDLCKVALWIEGHASGLPLSFLDNHVKNGDSLVGILNLGELEAGVPDSAYTAVTGDDKKVASAVKKENKAEQKESSLFRHNVSDDIDRIADAFTAAGDLPETTPDDVHGKEAAYVALQKRSEWQRAKWACDLWAAAFFAPLTEATKAAVPTTRNVWDAISGQFPQGRVAGLAAALADEQRFFHWPLEFPEVFAQGGFDVMLGNPPWDVFEFSEQAFFSNFRPDIARLPGANRKREISRLESGDPPLWQRYEIARRAVEKASNFFRGTKRFELAARGKLNTYALFIECSYRLRKPGGYSGQVVPTGIAAEIAGAGSIV